MELRFRQIHLDFHTSELVVGVGDNFDPDQFAATLEKARVNSVTVFARCHHGWNYYESKKHPERVHPQLVRRNLLVEQIEACHRRNIRTPIYTTINWDHYTCVRHPEWRQILPDGKLPGTAPLEPGFYGRLCLNTPYVDFLKDHVADVFACVPAVDGFFFDIVGVAECVCRRCMEEMRSLKIDPTRKEERLRFSKMVNDRFRHAMTAHVRSFSKDATVFYNQGHVGPAARESRDAFSHYELESLPSGGWGYAHFPVAIRYARTLGVDCMGMTGKFHNSWGDFHSFKNRAALEFECFQMLAQTAKCSVGDQLNPGGRLCPHVYELIGSVYSQVERKEAWCAGAKAVVDLAMLTPEEFTGEMMPPASVGAVRMLQAAAQQFDIIDTRSDFAPYKVLILPDRIQATEEFSAKIDRYLAAGGKVIASHESGLNAAKTEFALKALGVRLRANPTRLADGTLARYAPVTNRAEYAEYILPGAVLGKGLPPTEHAVDFKGVEIEAEAGTETLAPTVASLFNRTWEHFCSHRQAPSSGRVDYPAVTRRGGVIYFAHPIFTLYNQRAPRWCRTLLLNALDLLMPEPVLRHDGPTTVTATVTEQAAHGRWVVHLLHYIPERRGTDFDVIEDVIPLRNVTVSLRAPRKVKAVRCVPEGKALAWHEKSGRVEFTLPEICGHQMVEVVL